jgi:molecular chaperone DnaK (HSP70)
VELNFVIPNVWQRVGPRPYRTEVPAEVFAERLPAGPFLLALSWPAALTYLQVAVRSSPPRFSADAGEVAKLATRFGLQGAADWPGAGGKYRVVAGEARTGERLELEVSIDTDDPTFLAQAREAEDGLAVEVRTHAAAPPRDGVRGEVEAGLIRAHLEPARKMERYDGYVAVDLGHSRSVLAYLDAGADGGARAAGSLHVEGERGAALPTALRVLHYAPAADAQELETAEVAIGTRALALAGPDRPLGELILGAKRLLSQREQRPGALTLWQGGERFALDHRLPAELFVAELFRAFQRRRFEVPRQVAITCPPTFTTWDVDRLRQAVVQGWRRSLGARARGYDAARLRDLPALVLDEPSAAAYFFLFRDFLEGPGGLAAFRYLYPDGLGLLLFDCGGPATNIALVHAGAAEETGAVRLTLGLRGQTGLRHFGGDAITAAVLRLVKMRLAQHVARASPSARLRLPPPPADVEQLPAYLESVRTEVDALVPTSYQADERIPGASHQLRRHLAGDLWDIAEEVKAALAQRSEAAIGPALGPVRELLGRLGRQLPADLPAVSVRRAEVDVQVREGVLGAVERANRLLAGLPGEVHRVYLAGGGARYPLLAEVLRQRLEVRFLEDRLVLDEQEGKAAVAKGAVLALRTMAEYAGVRLEYELETAERLAFDVGYRDLALGSVRVLFRSALRYADLQPALVPLSAAPAGGRGQSVRELVLQRRWPGEEHFTPYLRFRFTRPVRGPVEVRFAGAGPHRHHFVARDLDRGEEAVEEDVERAEEAAEQSRL